MTAIADNTCNGGDRDKTVSSGALFNACNSLNTSFPTLGNKNNWRVPNKNELKLIINCNDTVNLPRDTSGCGSYTSPTINNLFPNTPRDNYWSSTTYMQLNLNAWYVDFSIGYITYASGSPYNYGVKTLSYLVRCVTSQ